MPFVLLYYIQVYVGGKNRGGGGGNKPDKSFLRANTDRALNNFFLWPVFSHTGPIDYIRYPKK